MLMQINKYIYIYIYAIYMVMVVMVMSYKNVLSAQFSHNGFVTTHALGHMAYNVFH